MKYQVGTTIKLKNAEELKRLDNENKLGMGYSSNGMDKYCGKIATIIEACEDYYKLDIDNGDWFWEDAMIENVKCEKDNYNGDDSYHIGFNFKGRVHEYIADEIKTLNPEGLCEFNRKDGKYMSIPYSWIEYIVPIGKEN